jgi:hypothetical protein
MGSEKVNESEWARGTQLSRNGEDCQPVSQSYLVSGAPNTGRLPSATRKPYVAGVPISNKTMSG